LFHFGRQGLKTTIEAKIMKVTKPLMITALVAGNLLVWNLALHAQGVTNTPPAAPPAGGPPPGGPPGPGMRGRPNHDRMIEQLNLTDEQKPKVKAILDDQRDKMRDVFQDQNLSREDRMAKMKSIRENTDAKLKAVLTADQFEKWQKTEPRMRGPRNGPPPGAPPPGNGGTNTPPAKPPQT
jgi:Spy/CpxP family protein refolding chaperone